MDFDTYYMQIAMAVRQKANCQGSRVGAVLVKDNRIVSTGYNGVPEGMTNCLDGGCLRCNNRDGTFESGTAYDLCICVHAEQNALLSAARFGISLEGATLYTTTRPCFGCAKELLQVKIQRVCYIHDWQPRGASGAALESRQHEYEKILGRIGSVKKLEIDDPDAKWATGQSIATQDQHGHG